jgi:hypothetical protein
LCDRESYGHMVFFLLKSPLPTTNQESKQETHAVLILFFIFLNAGVRVCLGERPQARQAHLNHRRELGCLSCVALGEVPNTRHGHSNNTSKEDHSKPLTLFWGSTTQSRSRVQHISSSHQGVRSLVHLVGIVLFPMVARHSPTRWNYPHAVGLHQQIVSASAYFSKTSVGPILSPRVTAAQKTICFVLFWRHVKAKFLWG